MSARLKPRYNKYRNVPHVIDGIRFASKKEAQRYSELKVLEKAKKISGLKLQPRYDLEVVYSNPFYSRRTHICYYVADFSYWQYSGKGKAFKMEEITEDVKGHQTEVFKLKAKLFEALYGRKITII